VRLQGALSLDVGGAYIYRMSTEDTAGPVTVSARAARRIAEILKTEPQPAMLRVAVTGGGCSGFQYNFALDDNRADDDLVLERDGATVLIDPMSLDFLRGAEIDFVDDLIGAAFKINNPNAQSSCGCGTSFSI
jgi:iron-sulfur cluster insertion protein